MSRSRHLDLDTSDDAVILGAGARARHRATVEEQLAAALAAAIGSSSTPGPRRTNDRAVRARRGPGSPFPGSGAGLACVLSTCADGPAAPDDGLEVIA